MLDQFVHVHVIRDLRSHLSLECLEVFWVDLASVAFDLFFLRLPSSCCSHILCCMDVCLTGLDLACFGPSDWPILDFSKEVDAFLPFCSHDCIIKRVCIKSSYFLLQVGEKSRHPVVHELVEVRCASSHLCPQTLIPIGICVDTLVVLLLGFFELFSQLLEIVRRKESLGEPLHEFFPCSTFFLDPSRLYVIPHLSLMREVHCNVGQLVLVIVPAIRAAYSEIMTGPNVRVFDYSICSDNARVLACIFLGH